MNSIGSASATFGLTELDVEYGAATATTATSAVSSPLDQHRMQTLLDQHGVGEDFANRWDARVVMTTASTNSDLLREARGGRTFARPVLLAAEAQTAGRGRLGRTWRSTAGASLTVSYGLCVARRLAALEGISLVCGLAVRDALARQGVSVQLKWPNDVLVDGRKLAGILVEAHARATSTIVIVGVGINVQPQAVDGAAESAVDADLERAHCAVNDRNILATDLAMALYARLARFTVTGFAAFASEWNAADAYRNRRVSLGVSPHQTTAGVERGVDDHGALLIEIDGETTRFIAGDLSLRAIAAS